MPRNPSEIARLEEEYAELKEQLKQSYWPKAQKASVIKQIREYERILGISGNSYNSSKF